MASVTVLSDLPEFVADHRPHGTLTGDATEPTPNGYMVRVFCSCGVVFMRWVTPVEAALDRDCPRSPSGGLVEIVFIGGWVLLAVAAGVYANRLHRDIILWPLISLLLSPIIAFGFLLALGKRDDDEEEEDDERVPCPFCAEDIKREALVCPFCHRDLPVQPGRTS
jgi:hypothetical protein